MEKAQKMKAIFWFSTAFLFLFNIVGVLIFRNNVRISTNTLGATSFFILTLIRGILAYVAKDEDFLFVFRRSYGTKHYWRYNKPTSKALCDFYLCATVYFAAIPFYLPLAVFSSRDVHTLWSVLVLMVPQFFIIGFDMQKIKIEMKKRKIKEELLEKERQEQEKREELGRWK